MSNYWIVVASKNHVAPGMQGGYVQDAHGKSNPLRRMKTGDGVIYYSPKIEYGGEAICQRFTAIGRVTGDEVYQFDMGNDFLPHRRNMKYLTAREAPIAPLVERLSFITDKHRWGGIFKFGIIRIPVEDFALIAKSMNADVTAD